MCFIGVLMIECMYFICVFNKIIKVLYKFFLYKEVYGCCL